MAKATIKVQDRPDLCGEVVRDEWDELREPVADLLDGAFSNPDKPEEITISLDGMSLTEWNALLEEERRDLQEYGAD